MRLWKIWKPNDIGKYYNEIVSEFTKYDEVIVDGTLLHLTEETENTLVGDL